MAKKRETKNKPVIKKEASQKGSVLELDEKKIDSEEKIVKKKLLAIFLFIFLTGLAFLLVKNWSRISFLVRRLFSGSVYSENQQRVIDNFGLPQTFTIAKDNGQILENWKYIYLDEIFVFQDGEFIVRQHFNFDVGQDEGIYLALEPKDFYPISNLEQINSLLVRRPSFESEINPEIAGQNQLFVSYDNLLNVTLFEGKVVGLQTVALKSAPQEDAVEKTEIMGDDVLNRPGKIFIGNSQQEINSFSYYLADPVFRLIKQRPLHLDGEYPSYGYCYSLDQGASFDTQPQDPGACADEESMVWLIDLLPLEIYDNLGELEMIGREELVRNRDFVYTITHTNGDLPPDLPNWPTILEDIKDDFSVPLAKEFSLILD